MRHTTLADARARSGLTQQALADACGVSRNTIWRLERGQTLPGYTTRERLERVLRARLTFAASRGASA